MEYVNTKTKIDYLIHICTAIMISSFRLTNWSDTSKMQLFLHQVQVSKALNTMIISIK